MKKTCKRKRNSILSKSSKKSMKDGVIDGMLTQQNFYHHDNHHDTSLDLVNGTIQSHTRTILGHPGHEPTPLERSAKGRHLVSSESYMWQNPDYDNENSNLNESKKSILKSSNRLKDLKDKYQVIIKEPPEQKVN